VGGLLPFGGQSHAATRGRDVQLRCPPSNWRALEPRLPDLASARRDENERPVRSHVHEELSVDPYRKVLKALDDHLGVVPQRALAKEAQAAPLISSGNRNVQQ
jgi:hypothetical protein